MLATFSMRMGRMCIPRLLRPFGSLLLPSAYSPRMRPSLSRTTELDMLSIGLSLPLPSFSLPPLLSSSYPLTLFSSSYRQDPGLQSLSASAALIAIWDDHEIANNPWTGGALNHNPGEGEWEDRKVNAIRAYHEWMPTRAEPLAPPVGPKFFRSFVFGDLARLLVLETRLVNRTNGEADPFPLEDDDGDGDPSNETPFGSLAVRVGELLQGVAPRDWEQTPGVLEGAERLRKAFANYSEDANKLLLGEEQLAWLRSNVEGMQEQGTRWLIVGQQLVMFDMFQDFDAVLDGSAAPAWMRLERRRELRDLLRNVTGWGCTNRASCTSQRRTYMGVDPTAYKAEQFGKEQEVTEEDREVARLFYALSKFAIPSSFDSWQGYAVERQR